jgi:spore maturation protein CgeB
MKNLLFIPLHWEHDAQQDFFNSFKKEYNAVYYTDTCFQIFKPDIIYTQCGAIDPSELATIKKNTGALVIQWTGNTRDTILDEVMIFKDIADVTFLASGIGQKDMYEAVLNHPVKYLQHGMAPWNFLPVQKDQEEKKVIFIGNNYDQFPGAVERNELCELLTKIFPNFEVWGNGYADATKYRNPNSIPYNDSPQLYNKSYIAIAANCYNDIEGYWCNRKLDIMAAGSCCFMRYVPGMENFFTDMVHGVFYKTNAEAVEKINMLLANPELRNKIAKSGQEIVQKYHTLDYRVIEIKKALKELGK